MINDFKTASYLWHPSDIAGSTFGGRPKTTQNNVKSAMYVTALTGCLPEIMRSICTEETKKVNTE